MGDPNFGGYPYSPYISCEPHSFGRTATTYTVLRQLLQLPLSTTNRATTKPSAYDSPSQRWGQRAVLAKPAQVQYYVPATLIQVWLPRTNACVTGAPYREVNSKVATAP